MVPGDILATCLCCRREFLYGIDLQALGRGPVYCRHCREHHQQLALVPKARKPRTRKLKAS
jgi:hypothetical protein